MIIALYVIFFVSLLAPIYTYAIYPIILKLLPGRQYTVDNEYKPLVSVIITNEQDNQLTEEKIISLKKLEYPDEKIEILICSRGVSEDYGFKVIQYQNDNKAEAIDIMLKAAQGKVILITDLKTTLDSSVVNYLVRHFSNTRVGCVVGQSRNDFPSLFWKYENFVRVQEGKIGRVSGANKAIYAIRNGIINSIPSNIINVDFYISTLIQQNNFDVLFEKDAIAYEIAGEQADHIREGAGNYQALSVFWRMLFPGRGSFVFCSHRVMKWLVPFNLIAIFITDAVLSFDSLLMLVLFIMQVLFYIAVISYRFFIVKKNRKPIAIVIPIISLAYYFLTVNVALLIGWAKYISRKRS